MHHDCKTLLNEKLHPTERNLVLHLVLVVRCAYKYGWQLSRSAPRKPEVGRQVNAIRIRTKISFLSTIPCTCSASRSPAQLYWLIRQIARARLHGATRDRSIACPVVESGRLLAEDEAGGLHPECGRESPRRRSGDSFESVRQVTGVTLECCVPIALDGSESHHPLRQPLRFHLHHGRWKRGLSDRKNVRKRDLPVALDRYRFYANTRACQYKIPAIDREPEYLRRAASSLG